MDAKKIRQDIISLKPWDALGFSRFKNATIEV